MDFSSPVAAVIVSSLSCANAGCAAINATAAVPHANHALDTDLKCDMKISLIGRVRAMAFSMAVHLRLFLPSRPCYWSKKSR
jgi:hypothetical protein